MGNTHLSSSEKARRTPEKHISLTHFLRRRWYRSPDVVREILSRCDVSPDVGELPPQLRRALAAGTDIRDVTTQFRHMLYDFLMDSARTIQHAQYTFTYQLPQIGALFGTTCQIIVPKNRLGESPWSGMTAAVCCMSFPELSASYALKIYYPSFHDANEDHGAMFEIPTALAACHAEPKDNNPVYMASFRGNPYMLSAWAGDRESGLKRHNENEIFIMSLAEEAARNYRHGRRIDFGETYQTQYGAARWRARKIYRILMAQITMGNISAARQIMARHENMSLAPETKRDFADAIEILKDLNPCYAANLLGHPR